MTDPERYLDAPASDIGARLLRSAADDGPTERSWQRALTATAAATAATAATGSGAASVVGGTATLWLKWLAIGVIAGGLSAYGADRWLRSEAGPPAVFTPIEARVETPAKATSEPTPVAPTAEPPVVAPTSERARASANASSSASSPPTDSLARELELVDAARKHLAAGDAVGTLARLDAYQKEFPRGRFPEEAGLMRAEASILRGDCATARALRTLFDGDSGKSVLSRRWKALGDRCP